MRRLLQLGMHLRNDPALGNDSRMMSEDPNVESVTKKLQERMNVGPAHLRGTPNYYLSFAFRGQLQILTKLRALLKNLNSMDGFFHRILKDGVPSGMSITNDNDVKGQVIKLYQ